jgi:hypothetical protein
MLGEGDIGATRLDPYDTGKATARLVIERNLVRTLDAQVELRFLPDGGLLPWGSVAGFVPVTQFVAGR